jgi:hypothetical protein
MKSNIPHINEIETESFRDRISTVDDKGKRNWIYAYKPKGKFYNIRTILSYIYFIVFFGLPFIHIDGMYCFYSISQKVDLSFLVKCFTARFFHLRLNNDYIYFLHHSFYSSFWTIVLWLMPTNKLYGNDVS